MKIDLVSKEINTFKSDNKLLREEKKKLLANIESLEKLLVEKEIRISKLISDKMDKNDQ